MHEFVPENMLKEAKSFLCWDVFKDLTVQLIPIQDEVAYYIPPGNPFHSIMVFYDRRQTDHSRALFLFFHEAGHVKQWLEFEKQRQDNKFFDIINLDKGTKKQLFELKAWLYGRELLNLFLINSAYKTDNILQQYDVYADKCIKSYKDSI
ncbi:hypothetical protein JXQ31_05925 [candidate division KSB1 bacterium]|nr:hypothetical protein [candidate division KSB1 bacterium]